MAARNERTLPLIIANGGLRGAVILADALYNQGARLNQALARAYPNASARTITALASRARASVKAARAADANRQAPGDSHQQGPRQPLHPSSSLGRGAVEVIVRAEYTDRAGRHLHYSTINLQFHGLPTGAQIQAAAMAQARLNEETLRARGKTGGGALIAHIRIEVLGTIQR